MTKKNVAIFTFGDVELARIESILIHAFKLAGYKSTIVGMNISSRKKYKKQWTNEAELRFASWPPPLVWYIVDRLVGALVPRRWYEAIDDVLRVSVFGVRIGKYALSSLMRGQRRGSPDLRDKAVRRLLKRELARSLSGMFFSKLLLWRLNADAVVMYDRGYTPLGQVFDHCLATDIPVVSVNAAHRNNILMLKRH